MTIPQGNWTIPLSMSIQRLRKLLTQHPPIVPDKHVGSGSDRYGTLGVLTQRETRSSQIGRLLLDPTRVGDNNRGMLLQSEKLDVAQWLNHLQIGITLPELQRPAVPGPRMNRKDKWQIAAQIVQHLQHR